jgi:beta-glucosidase
MSNPQHPYQNPTLSIAERVDNLLSLMTLEEKIVQLGSAWIYEVQNDDQSLSSAKLTAHLGQGIGQITRLAGGSVMEPVAVAEAANGIQRFLMEETRLGIPAMIHDECCSGFLARNATNFPQIIGCASTWQPGLVEAMTQVIRTQMRAVGVHQGLAPVLDIARDPRWGRIEETFGEDVYLTSSMGVAYIRGLQADKDWRQGVVATGKHFVGYSAGEGGLNWAPAHLPPRELHEVYLTPFEAAVKQAGLASMMNAYQELDGVPCGASKELLTDLLRGEWGFDGIVVSDYMAINQLADYHGFARNKAHAAHMALEAGMDVELPSVDCYGAELVAAVQAGEFPAEVADQAVRRVLEMKFRLGLFDNPYVETGKAQTVFDTPEQRELARTIAQQSMVLLKNEGDLLPLAKSVRSIAVIGPNADSKRNLLGDYSYPAHIETLLAFSAAGISIHPLPGNIHLVDNYAVMHSVLEAVAARVSPQTVVTYAQGCEVLDDSQAGFAEAVAAAQQADVAIVVVGDKAGLTPECSTGEFRDRTTLGLPGVQQQLVEAIYATGKPLIVVLANGRPFAIPWIVDHVPAVLEAWLPGEEGAEAIADVLFGDVNPGGKLPVTVVRSAGQIPLFYNHKPSGARSFFYGPYVDESNEPLFPFGFGLSYTRFNFANLSISPDQATADGSVTITVDVTNVGDVAGDEVVQLYTRTLGASVTRPVKELRGFKRIRLAPGECKRVTFVTPITQLSYHDRAMARVVEPATVQVMVGNSSQHLPLKGSFEIVGEKVALGADWAMFGATQVG